MTPKYMSVTFTDSENRPVMMVHSQQSWTMYLADIMLGVGRDEFNPTHMPRMVGYKNTTPVYEIEVTEAAAERIRKLSHPDVMLVTEAVSRPKVGFGALDPSVLDGIEVGKKPKGPKTP